MDVRIRGAYVNNRIGIILFGVGSERPMILAVSSASLCLILELEMLIAHFKRLVALIIDCFSPLLIEQSVAEKHTPKGDFITDSRK